MRRLLSVALLLGLMAGPLLASPDPNESESYPDGGYGIIICGNSTVFGDPTLDALIKQLLREAYLAMTENLGLDPNNVWVLVDWGDDSWTEGLFDALPATESQIADTFQTIGHRMWSDPVTPKNLVVVIGGHGGNGYYGTESMRLQMADGMLYDYAFIANCVNQINNNPQSGSPIERLDVLATMCYSGALINDFRDNFHTLRGSTWPNATHFSMATAGDVDDITTGFLGVQLVLALREDGTAVIDLNGDGELSIFEYFNYAAQADLTNPTDGSYVPYVTDVIYVPSAYYYPIYWDGNYLAEHPLYTEWNAPPPPCTLTIECVLDTQGHVEADPAPADPNVFEYPVGTEVELTAVPVVDRVFKHWEIADPNHPGDANHVTLDSNNPVTIVMDSDQHVRAVFGCSSGMGQALPMMAVGLLVCGVITRRRRR